MRMLVARFSRFLAFVLCTRALLDIERPGWTWPRRKYGG